MVDNDIQYYTCRFKLSLMKVSIQEDMFIPTTTTTPHTHTHTTKRKAFILLGNYQFYIKENHIPAPGVSSLSLSLSVGHFCIAAFLLASIFSLNFFILTLNWSKVNFSNLSLSMVGVGPLVSSPVFGGLEEETLSASAGLVNLFQNSSASLSFFSGSSIRHITDCSRETDGWIYKMHGCHYYIYNTNSYKWERL